MSTSPARNLILGTAGHIDHGKTSLVEALTGINTDRLPEEQRTGMTIDLGFAPLDLGPDRVGIVDVPGHERFIKNMVAGATGVDLALLVIAADDSVMPQTLEHLETLELLGVTEGLIALTKVDLVSAEQRREVIEEIGIWLADTAFAEAEIVPVSSVTGEGIEVLRDRLATLVTQVRRERGGAHFRLPIDRVFTISGAGAVVTGSILSGSVRVGDTVELLPSQRRVRVRGVHRHEEPRPEAHAGQRAGLNLAGVDYDEVERGEEVAAPGYLEPSRILETWLRCLPGAARSFRLRSSAHLCLGTGDTPARLMPLETDELKPGQEGLAQIHAERPVVADYGQRFILRSAATGRVVGGGMVLRPMAAKRRRKDATANRSLHTLRKGDARSRLRETLRLAGAAPRTAAHLCRDAGVSPAQLRPLLEALSESGEVVRLLAGEQETFLHREVLLALEDLCLDTTRAHHETHPLEPGIPEAQLSSRVSHRLPETLWSAVRERLLRDGRLRREGDRLALAEFEVDLSPEAQRLSEQCLRALQDGWFGPPLVDELPLPAGTTPQDRRSVLELLQLAGEVVKIAPELWMTTAALTQAKQRLAEAIERTGPLTIAGVRDALDTSRKYAVPLCEYLDQVRFTRRHGDARVLAGEQPGRPSEEQP